MVVWEHSQPRSTRHSQKWTRHAPSFCSQKPHFHIFSPWQKPHPSPLFLVPGTAWSSYRGSTPGPVQRPVRCSLTVRVSDGLHPGFGSTKKSSFSTDMELDIEIVPKKTWSATCLFGDTCWWLTRESFNGMTVSRTGALLQVSEWPSARNSMRWPCLGCCTQNHPQKWWYWLLNHPFLGSGNLTNMAMENRKCHG